MKMKYYWTLILVSLLSSNTKEIHFLLMQIGDKISLIEELTKFQELKLKRKGSRFFKGKIENLEKSFQRKND